MATIQFFSTRLQYLSAETLLVVFVFHRCKISVGIYRSNVSTVTYGVDSTKCSANWPLLVGINSGFGLAERRPNSAFRTLRQTRQTSPPRWFQKAIVSAPQECTVVTATFSSKAHRVGESTAELKGMQ